jgi:hypothetical protein
MINPYLVLAGVVAAVSLAVGGFQFGVKYANGRHAVTEQIIADVREQAQLGAADAISKIEVRHVTIRQKAEEVIREVPVYRDCVNDPRVERLLDDARSNRDAEPPSHSVVP